MRFIRSVNAFLPSVLLVSLAMGQDEPQDSFVIRDVRLFDGETVQERRSVVVVDGLIDRVGGRNLRAEGLPIEDGQGRTLLPGLIDSHVHLPGFGTGAVLSQNAQLGVTTVIDMGGAGISLERVRSLKAQDGPQHASIVMAGLWATATGGHPTQMAGGDFPTIDDPEMALEFVDERVTEGSDFLKVIYDDLAWLTQAVPMIDAETLAALVDAAHDRGLLAIAHIGTEARARVAIDAGVDGLAHLFGGDGISANFGELAAQRGIFVIPTLSVLPARVACRVPRYSLRFDSLSIRACLF